MIKKHMH